MGATIDSDIDKRNTFLDTSNRANFETPSVVLAAVHLFTAVVWRVYLFHTCKCFGELGKSSFPADDVVPQKASLKSSPGYGAARNVVVAMATWP